MFKHINKLQIASVRLGDTIYGFFAGAHPATTIDNARAISEVLKGLRNYYLKKNLIDNVVLSLDESEKRTRQLSNFSKHADRDSEKRALYINQDAHNALYSAVSDYIALAREMRYKNIISICPEDMLIVEAPDAPENKIEDAQRLSNIIKNAIFELPQDLTDSTLAISNSLYFLFNLFEEYSDEYFGMIEKRKDDKCLQALSLLDDTLASISFEAFQIPQRQNAETAIEHMSQVEGHLIEAIGLSTNKDEQRKRDYLQMIQESASTYPIPDNGGIIVCSEDRNTNNDSLVYQSIGGNKPSII